MKRKLLFASILAAATLTISCSSEDNDIFVDDKPFNLDELKDKTTAPGDDFFRYCNGAWYDAAIVPDSTGNISFLWSAQEESVKAMFKEQSTNPTLPFLKTLKADYARRSETLTEDLALIRSYMDGVDGLTTMHDLLQYAGQLMKMDVPSLLTPSFYVHNKKAMVMLDYTSYQQVDISADSICRLGYTKEQAQKMLDNATKMSKVIKAVAAPTLTLKERLHKPVTDEEYKWAVAHMGSRATANDNISVMLNGMGLSRDVLHSVIEQEAGYYNMINKFTDAKVPEIKDYMKVIIAQSLIDNTAFCKDSYSKVLKENDYIQHALSKLYTETYCTSQTKEYIKTLCENIRASLINRVHNVDWMVENTMRTAADKVADIKFFCCFPDKWNDALVNPTVSGKSYLQDNLELAQQVCGVLISECGRTDDDAIWDVLQTLMPLHLINACYIPETNFIFITSAIACAPIVDITKSDAYNYGVIAMIIGHEMTHGLDSTGSKYDKDGNLFDWWTMDDKLKFKERQQMLINVYNNIVVMPGVYQNGEKTLGENIADLGGTLAAYDAFVALRESQGCFGDELTKQKKLFLESFANFWSEKLSPKMCLDMQKKDVHSNSIARVNGVVCNFPDWYTLYDVRANNKLYLAPERRVSIW